MGRSGFSVMSSAILDKFHNSVWIIPLYIAVVILLGVTISRSIVDFKTSLMGVEMLNMPSMNDPGLDNANIWGLAIAPQALILVLTYVAFATSITDRSFLWLKIFSVALLVVCLVVDVYTGYLFYAQGSRYPFALAFFVDTAFSEIGVTVAFGLTLSLLPHTIKVTGDTVNNTLGALRKVSGREIHSRPTPSKPLNQPPRIISNKSKDVPMGPPVRNGNPMDFEAMIEKELGKARRGN